MYWVKPYGKPFASLPKGVDSYANVYVDNGNIEVRNILLPSRTNLTGRFIADTVMAKDRNVVWNWSECLMQTPPPAALLANKVATGAYIDTYAL